MAFAFSTDNPKIELEEESTSQIIFKVEIPQDSRARTKDVGVTTIVKEKILLDTSDAGTAADSTSKLMDWSIVPAEKKGSLLRCHSQS